MMNDATTTPAEAAPVHAFLNAMSAAGIPPHDPGDLVPDGRLHRYRVDGDKPGSRNGWLVLHLDGVPSGAFGSWKAGISESWSTRPDRQLTEAEREQHRQRMAAVHRERDRERQQRQAKAADTAKRFWSEAEPANRAHPYLQAKNVPPLRARQLRARLVLPVYEYTTRDLVSLQFIDGYGRKMLLKGGRKQGCVIPVAAPDGWRRLLIAEGWATGASLAAIEPDALVLAAIDAGNLQSVALAARQDWKTAEIVVAGDAGPVGESKARAAALAVGGLVAIPPLEDGGDWNDWANGEVSDG